MYMYVLVFWGSIRAIDFDRLDVNVYEHAYAYGPRSRETSLLSGVSAESDGGGVYFWWPGVNWNTPLAGTVHLHINYMYLLTRLN